MIVYRYSICLSENLFCTELCEDQTDKVHRAMAIGNNICSTMVPSEWLVSIDCCSLKRVVPIIGTITRTEARSLHDALQVTSAATLVHLYSGFRIYFNRRRAPIRAGEPIRTYIPDYGLCGRGTSSAKLHALRQQVLGAASRGTLRIT